MYARSTTIQGRPDRVDAGIDFVRDEVMPTILGIEGCTGLSMLCDRTSGCCIVTSAWRTQEAMRASDETLQPLRERGMDLLAGTMDVEEWEIAVMHRDHPAHDGAAARVTWMQTDPQQIDQGIQTFRMGVLPMAEQLRGWCSASLLVDRGTGRAVATSTYESAEAMEASRGSAEQLRHRTVSEVHGQILQVMEFELALAHLHVPEMA